MSKLTLIAIKLIVAGAILYQSLPTQNTMENWLMFAFVAAVLIGDAIEQCKLLLFSYKTNSIKQERGHGLYLVRNDFPYADKDVYGEEEYNERGDEYIDEPF